MIAYVTTIKERIKKIKKKENKIVKIIVSEGKSY